MSRTVRSPYAAPGCVVVMWCYGSLVDQSLWVEKQSNMSDEISVDLNLLDEHNWAANLEQVIRQVQPHDTIQIPNLSVLILAEREAANWVGDRTITFTIPASQDEPLPPHPA